MKLFSFLIVSIYGLSVYVICVFPSYVHRINIWKFHIYIYIHTYYILHLRIRLSRGGSLQKDKAKTLNDLWYDTSETLILVRGCNWTGVCCYFQWRHCLTAVLPLADGRYFSTGQREICCVWTIVPSSFVCGGTGSCASHSRWQSFHQSSFHIIILSDLMRFNTLPRTFDMLMAWNKTYDYKKKSAEYVCLSGCIYSALSMCENAQQWVHWVGK